MRIDQQTIRRIIKEELEAVLDEDLSNLGFISPNAALKFMKDELNGKTWVFWDLETIGFDGQITQFAAFSYKIEDISKPPPADYHDSIVIKCSLNPETLEQQAMEREQLKDPNSELSIKKQKMKEKGQDFPVTVDDMLAYTHYDDFEPGEEEMQEQQALIKFVDWFNSQENKVSVGHNIMSFDRRRIIQLCNKYGIDSTAFADIDIFDTVLFSRTLFKKAMTDAAEKGDKQAEAMYVASEEGKRYMSMKLQQLMNVFGDPNRIQLHTADDDTKQLVDVFFTIYRKVEEVLEKGGAKYDELSDKDIEKMHVEIANHMLNTGQMEKKHLKSVYNILRGLPPKQIEQMVVQLRTDPNAIIEV